MYVAVPSRHKKAVKVALILSMRVINNSDGCLGFVYGPGCIRISWRASASICAAVAWNLHEFLMTSL